ncbi:unnamed protein product [Paramecium octaurelia]|uniref:Transmembrane protein n=1 Tax=Paramecium octaurelia TaxID=43137 RepID=A0A8S1VCC5_PAROT|nr:unnamed protein product [Paramecium octaurelia]
MLNNILLESRRNEENQAQRNSESSVPDNSTMQTNNLQQSSNLNLTTQEAGSHQIYQPLLQPNQQLSGLDDQQKQRFLIQITGIWVFQEAIQIIMSVITILDFNYDNLFYNFDKEKYRASLYLFFLISAIQLLLIRFYKPFRCKHNAFFIFLIFTISYALWISGLITAEHSDIWNIENSVQIGFAIFIGIICNFLTLITIQYHFSLTKQQISFFRTIKYVCIPPFIYAFIFQIFNPFDYTAVLIFWMATELWAFTFGGLYLYSVLQIVNVQSQSRLNNLCSTFSIYKHVFSIRTYLISYNQITFLIEFKTYLFKKYIKINQFQFSLPFRIFNNFIYRKKCNLFFMQQNSRQTLKEQYQICNLNEFQQYYSYFQRKTLSELFLLQFEFIQQDNRIGLSHKMDNYNLSYIQIFYKCLIVYRMSLIQIVELQRNFI